MKKTISFVLVAVFMLWLSSESHASMWDWFKAKSQTITSTKLSDTSIGAGLKEALRVGTENTIKLLGKKDGYFGNQAVKILVPESLRKAEPTLRQLGLGPKIDEFTLSMNRAAEKAAPLAADAFATAITDMSIDDANKILKGGDTAATDYFKARTYNGLLEKFQPVVNKAMEDYAVTKNFNALTSKVQNIPLLNKVGNVDLTKYVSSKALDGLYFTLGQEEKKIRQNPAARTTELLKTVFSNSAR